MAGTCSFEAGATFRTSHVQYNFDVAWSPDGSSVATANGDASAQVHDVETGALLAKCDDHGETVTAVTWSPDGRKMATSSWDRTVAVWDVNPHTSSSSTSSVSSSKQRGGSRSAAAAAAAEGEGEEKRVVQVALRHTGMVSCASWSPDGGAVASAGGGSTDPHVLLWDLKTFAATKIDELNRRNCPWNLAWRGATQAELVLTHGLKRRKLLSIILRVFNERRFRI